MRLFVGIDIPPEIKEKINDLVFNLVKQIKNPVKWVEKENFHVNLKFLDEVSENNVKEIKQLIKEATVKGLESTVNGLQTTVQINDVLVFPNINQPRVIGLKITFTDDLMKLAITLNKNLEKLPYIKKEFKPFRPHLTLGRIKFNLTEAEKGIISDIKFKDEFQAKEICLFESKLNSGGPVYKIIERFVIYEQFRNPWRKN